MPQNLQKVFHAKSKSKLQKPEKQPERPKVVLNKQKSEEETEKVGEDEKEDKNLNIKTLIKNNSVNASHKQIYNLKPRINENFNKNLNENCETAQSDLKAKDAILSSSLSLSESNSTSNTQTIDLALESKQINLNDKKSREFFESKDLLSHVILLTGAGISTPTIPDFRSKTGLFNQIRKNYKVSGKEAFDYKFSIDSNTRNVYLKIMNQLGALIKSVEPNEKHRSIAEWSQRAEYFRVYDQNIDVLLRKAGLKEVCFGEVERIIIEKEKDLSQKGKRKGKLATQSSEENKKNHKNQKMGESRQTGSSNLKSLKESQSEKDAQNSLEPNLIGQLVHLHGTHSHVKCSFCGHRVDFSIVQSAWSEGEEVDCEMCTERTNQQNSRNAIKGVYNTEIIHYNQEHPFGEELKTLFEYDLCQKGDKRSGKKQQEGALKGKNLKMGNLRNYKLKEKSKKEEKSPLLVVLGTSLKVHGIRQVLRPLINTIKANGGTTVLVDFNCKDHKMFEFVWKGDIQQFLSEVLRNTEKNETFLAENLEIKEEFEFIGEKEIRKENLNGKSRKNLVKKLIEQFDEKSPEKPGKATNKLTNPQANTRKSSLLNFINANSGKKVSNKGKTSKNDIMNENPFGKSFELQTDENCKKTDRSFSKEEIQSRIEELARPRRLSDLGEKYKTKRDSLKKQEVFKKNLKENENLIFHENVEKNSQQLEAQEICPLEGSKEEKRLSMKSILLRRAKTSTLQDNLQCTPKKRSARK